MTYYTQKTNKQLKQHFCEIKPCSWLIMGENNTIKINITPLGTHSYRLLWELLQFLHFTIYKIASEFKY